ncbi:MAG: gfo/Idh/MocA family oxidoreductase, partial [Flavihumibacter sp.]
MKQSRRHFIRQTALTASGLYLGANSLSAASYRRIIGANDRVRVGVIGFSDRHRQSHLPCFLHHCKTLNFDITAVSDIWKLRREAGVAAWKKALGHDIASFRNNEELYNAKVADAVFISTADFQH